MSGRSTRRIGHVQPVVKENTRTQNTKNTFLRRISTWVFFIIPSQIVKRERDGQVLLMFCEKKIRRGRTELKHEGKIERANRLGSELASY